MSAKILSVSRARQILAAATKTRVLVLGDVMLDQFIWGGVSRISPEAPVPVVDFERESFMPGGAANVARNLTAFNVPVDIFGVIGSDDAGRRLKILLNEQKIGCSGLVTHVARHTSVKTRIVAHKQQMVRIDRETRDQIRIIIEQATVPVVVDAGLGAPSHAAEAMEMGADAVLVNTAVAVSSDPNRMAVAFKMAVEAGRTAFEAGLGATQETASATSPLTAFLD